MFFRDLDKTRSRLTIRVKTFPMRRCYYYCYAWGWLMRRCNCCQNTRISSSTRELGIFVIGKKCIAFLSDENIERKKTREHAMNLNACCFLLVQCFAARTSGGAPVVVASTQGRIDTLLASMNGEY